MGKEKCKLEHENRPHVPNESKLEHENRPHVPLEQENRPRVPKRILYFEPFSGISGDMALAALLDLGLDRDEFFKRLGKLGLDAYDIEVKKGVKGGITGTDVTIRPHYGMEDHDDHDHTHEHGHGHDHGDHAHDHHSHDPSDHAHDHHSHAHDDHSHAHGDHGHAHDDHSHDLGDPGRPGEHVHDAHDHHSHAHAHSPAKHPTHIRRTYKAIKALIEGSLIPDKAKYIAVAIFEKLAIVEGKIHGIPHEDVEFHEVGGIDSIVDIVGTAICIDMLEVDAIFAAPVNVGGGTVKSRHGTLPVPAPATLELLKNIPIYSKGNHGELTTPTGAAILAALCESFGEFPAMSVQRTGYGLGKRDCEFPNCLRVALGESGKKEEAPLKAVVIECNIDDMGGEFFGYTMEKLVAEGALDVWHTPIQMKKNRPAVKLSVLCRTDDADRFCAMMLRETTTLGVRSYPVDRMVLDRQLIKVDTKYGPVTIKTAKSDGIHKAMPEYEDCKRLAVSCNVPLKEVYDAAWAAYSAQKSEH